MPLPSIFLGVTVKQLVVLVTLGCVAAYLINAQDEAPAEHLALEAFIRNHEQVHDRVGAVLDISLVRQMVAYPGYATVGYTRSEYVVEGERGTLAVTLKTVAGDPTIEVTQLRRQ